MAKNEMCEHCGLKVRQEMREVTESAPKGLYVALTDDSGREGQRYLVPADERLERSVIRMHPCGRESCSRQLQVEDGKAFIA